MSKTSIEIYLRVKPTKKAAEGYDLDIDEKKLLFDIPKDENQGIVNNSREHYKFKFNDVFDMDSKQDLVFDRIAKPVISG